MKTKFQRADVNESGGAKAQMPKGLKELAEEYWDISLLLKEHHGLDGKTYVVKMQSKCGQTDPLFFPAGELENSKQEKRIIEELANRGGFGSDMFEPLKEFVKFKKILGETSEDDGSYKRYFLGQAETVGGEESMKMYERVVEHVMDNKTVFPTKTSNNYCEGYSKGQILDDEKSLRKYKCQTVAIVAAHLNDIYRFRNTKVMNALLLKLESKGLVFTNTDETRKQVTLGGKVQKCYVFKIDFEPPVESGDSNV